MNRGVTQTHLGLLLDSKLDFQEHSKIKESKITRTTGFLRKLQRMLPRLTLITIYT